MCATTFSQINNENWGFVWVYIIIKNCAVINQFSILLFSSSNRLVTQISVYVHNKPLRKHAYSNILKILPPENENWRLKKSNIFHISAQNIDCGYSLEPPRQGGSNEYPQSMFWAEIKKNNVYPCKPQFYYIKVGFKGVKII